MLHSRILNETKRVMFGKRNKRENEQRVQVYLIIS